MSNRKLYTCDNCGYNTYIKCNFNTHLMRKIPCKKKDITTNNSHNNNEGIQINNATLPNQNESLLKSNVDVTNNNENTCCKCKKVFANKSNLKRHLSICKGVDSLTCPVCFKSFNKQQGKYQHMKNVKCTPPPPPEMIANNNANCHNNIINNITNQTINQVINNTTNQIVNYNVTHVKLNAFGEEDFSHLVNNHELLRSFLRKKETGVLECANMMYADSEHPENWTIRKLNRKDDFVEVYNGKEWKMVYKDYAYKKVKYKVGIVLTDEVDYMIETDTYKKHSYTIRSFYNYIALPMDWEFESTFGYELDSLLKDKATNEEAKKSNMKVSRGLFEMLYRESKKRCYKKQPKES